jgi:hypothetical protein
MMDSLKWMVSPEEEKTNSFIFSHQELSICLNEIIETPALRGFKLSSLPYSVYIVFQW